jgi:hypothetical protein
MRFCAEQFGTDGQTDFCDYMSPYDFACGSVWVWNLVSDIKGGTQTEGVLEQGAEERWSDGRLEKTA